MHKFRKRHIFMNLIKGSDCASPERYILTHRDGSRKSDSKEINHDITRVMQPTQTLVRPLWLTWINLIPIWINNHIPNKLWGEITNPFPNFNGCTVEVWEYTLPAKIMEYFPFQRFFAFLWCMKGVSLFEIHSYEQILLLGEVIPS